MIQKIFLNEVSTINKLGLHSTRAKFAKVDTFFILQWNF
jgi:hypothetical protein